MPLLMNKNRKHHLFLKRDVHVMLIIFFALCSATFFVYQVKSIISLENTELKQSAHFPQCRLCDLMPLNPPSSSSRDVVLTATTSRIDRVELLVRSIRSTRSRCRIVVLVPRGTIIPNIFIDCGVEVIEMHSLSSRTMRSPHKMRWEWYYEYLLQHISEFDRILHTDAFDAFVQSDPFPEWISPEYIYAITEDQLIKDCPINSEWVKKCAGKEGYDSVARKRVLCSGSLIGGAKLFMKVVGEMVNNTNWDDCWQKAHDQGAFNFLMYSKLVKIMPIKFLGCLSPYLTMSYCSSSQNIFFDKEKRLYKPLPIGHPIYVHQYNRYKQVDKEFQRKCGKFIDRNSEISESQNQSSH